MSDIESILGALLDRPDPVSFLKDSFDKVSFGEYSGTVTCAVPNLFVFKGFYGASRLRCKFNRELPRRITNGEYGMHRSIVTLEPLQGRGRSEEESAMDLAEHFMSGGYGVMYEPKEDDQYEPVMGAKYVTIHENDRLHEHGDTGMMDFRLAAKMSPFAMRVEIDENYGDYHSHLIPEQDFYDRLRNER